LGLESKTLALFCPQFSKYVESHVQSHLQCPIILLGHIFLLPTHIFPLGHTLKFFLIAIVTAVLRQQVVCYLVNYIMSKVFRTQAVK
jgi:hypothetical protein